MERFQELTTTHYRRLFEHLPNTAVIVFDHDLKLLMVSGPALGHAGLEPEDLEGRFLHEVVHPDAVDLLTGYYRRALAGETVSVEYRSIRTRRSSHLQVVPLHADTGEIDGGMAISIDTTDRVDAERISREANAQFETAFADAPFGIALVNLEGRFLKVNQTLCETIGWTAEELLLCNFQDITPPAGHAAERELMRRFTAGEIEGHQAERRYVLRSGEESWLQLSVRLVRDGAGRPRHYVVQVMDITERRRSQEALEEERAALDEAQRIAHVGSWTWEPDGDLVTWSAEMYRIFGRDPEAGPVHGAELLEYVHPEDRRQVADGYGRAFDGAARFQLTGRVIRGTDGSVRWVYVNGHRAAGHPGRYIGTVQDVSEIRQAELEATRQRDYVQALITATREGFLLSQDGVVVDANPAFSALTGYTRDELIGMTIPYAFWAPESQHALFEHARRLRTSDQAIEIETTYLRKDGERIEVAITTVATSHSSDGPISFVSTIRDITQQKRDQAALEHLATRDPLTSLLNQRVFREQLRSEIARAVRHDVPLSVAILDLDHFKEINDRFGHPVGDQVLVEVADRLRRLVRDGEHIARIGGEEFAWILPSTDAGGAFAAGERARQAIAATPFAAVGSLTLSVGVCQLADGADMDRLYQHADQALYTAKQQGRNQTVTYAAPSP